MPGLKCAAEGCNKSTGDYWYGVCCPKCFDEFTNRFPFIPFDEMKQVYIPLRFLFFATDPIGLVKSESAKAESVLFKGIPARFIHRAYKGIVTKDNEQYLLYDVYVPKFGPRQGQRFMGK